MRAIRNVTLLIVLSLGCCACAGTLRAEDDEMVLGGGRRARDAAPIETSLQSAEAGAGSTLKAWGGLLIFFGLAGGSMWLMRRYKPQFFKQAKAEKSLEVLERMQLGARRELVVVRVGGRALILASLAQDVKLIHSLPVEALLPAEPEPTFEEMLQEDQGDRPGIDRAMRQAVARACTPPNRKPAPWPGFSIEG